MEIITIPDKLLNDGWSLRSLQTEKQATINFPGDVHSALLAAGVIGDPYWRDTETSLDWVHEDEWIAQREFIVNGDIDHYLITLHSVDCHAIVSINGAVIGRCESQFIRYDFDISKVLVNGSNTIEIHFLSNPKIASQRQSESEWPVPYLSWNCRIPHMNFIRKPACHAGWDWNIALAPMGVYGDIRLRKCLPARLDDVLLRQLHTKIGVTVEVEVSITVTQMADIEVSMEIDALISSTTHLVYPGQSKIVLSLLIEDPILWWPVGLGSQHLYALEVRVGDELRHFDIGLRHVHLNTDKDAVGHQFALNINGHNTFMRGVNWIPADALPARGTPETVGDLLQSAVDANMNMIRIWGGGQYEEDWFYTACDKLGLLVWQDFMFSCNLYPAADRQWLALVRTEAEQQVQRLSVHPSVVLWCGDNELVGALTWFEESKRDRDRYLVMYDRLNHTLEDTVECLNPGIPFWPSSPSVGRLNYGDGWHDDTSGDMHFWDVWHSAKDFEHYRTVIPRFCSEFGFQSFPSKRVIASFTKPEDRNVSSTVMEVHQRNDGGNRRIVETISRYFNPADSFEELTYLSQISQGLAMKTAVEYWRANKPRCMGTLYWQLNDTWPVASWSSLEYGGGWKPVHYLARRFYAPILVCVQPDADSGDYIVWATNDTTQCVAITVNVHYVAVSGSIRSMGTFEINCDDTQSVNVARLSKDSVSDDEIIYLTWRDTDGLHSGENEYFPKRPKQYQFETPSINVTEQINDSGETEVVLLSKQLALYVTYNPGADNIYSDNCFTLLPDTPKVLMVARERQSHLDEHSIVVHHL